MTSEEPRTSPDPGMATTEPPVTGIEELWQWLLREPWGVVIIAAIPCILIIVVSIAVACCLTKRSKSGYRSAASKETADDEDSKGLPSEVIGALEMVTIEHSETVTVDTSEEAAHPAMGEILRPRSAGPRVIGEQNESSIAPLDLPTGRPNDEEQKDAEWSHKQRSFKQHTCRTSSTSSQQKTLAYVEVELNPVTEENKAVIISTEQPTQYVEIAGIYKPFIQK